MQNNKERTSQKRITRFSLHTWREGGRNGAAPPPHGRQNPRGCKHERLKGKHQISYGQQTLNYSAKYK